MTIKTTTPQTPERSKFPNRYTNFRSLGKINTKSTAEDKRRSALIIKLFKKTAHSSKTQP